MEPEGRARILTVAVWLIAGWLAFAPAAAQEPGGRGAARNRVTFLHDSRLEADSALFPHQWPALDRLRTELVRLRPALESDSLEALTASLPQVRTLVDTLAADTVPSLLAPRRAELRDHIVALADALRRAGDLGAAALAAAPDTVAPRAGAPALPGFPAGESGGMAVVAPPTAAESLSGAAAAGPEAPSPRAGIPDSGWIEPPGPSDSLAGDTVATGALPSADSLEPQDPVGAYLAVWREIYAHEEALLHRVRDPFGT